MIPALAAVVVVTLIALAIARLVHLDEQRHNGEMLDHE